MYIFGINVLDGGSFFSTVTLGILLGVLDAGKAILVFATTLEGP